MVLVVIRDTYLRTLSLPPPFVFSSFVHWRARIAMPMPWRLPFSRTTRPLCMGSPLQYIHSSSRQDSLGRTEAAELEGRGRLVIVRGPGRLAEQTFMVRVCVTGGSSLGLTGVGMRR